MYIIKTIIIVRRTLKETQTTIIIKELIIITTLKTDIKLLLDNRLNTRIQILIHKEILITMEIQQTSIQIIIIPIGYFLRILLIQIIIRECMYLNREMVLLNVLIWIILIMTQMYLNGNT